MAGPMKRRPVPPGASRHFLFVNGIEAESNDLDAWQFRAADAINRAPTPDKASTYHYEVAWWSKWFLQRRHVPRLAAKVRDLGMWGRDVVLVGHSNGAELICAAFRACPELVAAAVHLIGAACNRSFEKNGLNAALLSGAIGRVYVHFNPGDRVLRVANYSFTYGDLGRHGPQDVDERVRRRVIPIERLGVGHSRYFEPGPAFERTMLDITARG